MRAALLISGYLRSFRFNVPEIRKKILEKFDSVDIYIHITKDESINDRYYNDVNENEDILFITKELSPVTILYEDDIARSGDRERDSLINNWLKYYKLNSIKKINEQSLGKYDIVIKHRPDLSITSDEIFTDCLKRDTVYLPKETVIDKCKLANPTDPSLCDIFAYGTSESMDAYFNLYNHIEDLIEKHGTVSETLLYYYLNKFINYEETDIEYTVILSVCNVFAICGDSGSGKTTLGKILESYFKKSFTLECDRYHKWEREDSNWKRFTHLNPEANFLTKMHKDIFDLKIGKAVYQIDYDHQTGKFTDKQKISKNDNIIVCGLHSLHYENNNIYNLKIFIDTDVNLKKSWKIKRDISKRGYTLQKIAEQIESREDDYYKYIQPQRDCSDIIINFYTTEEFDYTNYEKDLSTYLRIMVNKKYNICDMLNELSNNNIEYTLSEVHHHNFNSLTFSVYTESNILNKYNAGYGDFYDYIMFFILSLHNRVAL